VVDSSGLENRYSSKELSRVRIPLSPFSYFIFLYCTNMLNSSGSAILSRLAESEQKKKKIQKYQLRGVMNKTGSKSRSIPFSNPAAAARALPACHK
jgi:hypothetical protein